MLTDTMSTSTFWALVRVRADGTVRGAEEGPGRLSLLGGTPSRGSYVVASAGILGSRVPMPTLALHLGECQGGPGVPPVAARLPGVDLDAFRWLLTDEGQAVLARAVEATADPEHDELAVQAQLRRRRSADHVAAALTQAELRRRAVPKFGDLAARMYFTPDGLEQATRLAWPPIGRAASRLRTPARPSTWAAASAATCWRSPGPGSPRPASSWTRCASRWRRPTSPPSGSTGPSRAPTRPRSTPRRSTWPSPTPHDGAAGAARSASTSGPRPGRSSSGCCARRVRQGRAGHPALPRAGRRGGRVGQRPRRGQGGGAVVGPARHGRAPRDRHRRRRAGHADRGGRPGTVTGSVTSAPSCTNRTVP